MSAIISHNYLDFFHIAIDAYKVQEQRIYRKLMMTIMETYKAITHNIELSMVDLNNNDTLHLNENELEEFYEDIYSAIDVLKLYQKELKELKGEDVLFEDMYVIIDKLYTIMVQYLDRVSTMEVKAIQQRYKDNPL